MRIVDANNTRAVDALFARKEAVDRTFERRVAAIVQRVRTEGDRAVVRLARKFDHLSQTIEVTRDEMQAAAATVAPALRAAIRQAARNIARVAARQIPKHFDVEVVPGV